MYDQFIEQKIKEEAFYIYLNTECSDEIFNYYIAEAKIKDICKTTGIIHNGYIYKKMDNYSDIIKIKYFDYKQAYFGDIKYIEFNNNLLSNLHEQGNVNMFAPIHVPRS